MDSVVFTRPPAAATQAEIHSEICGFAQKQAGRARIKIFYAPLLPAESLETNRFAASPTLINTHTHAVYARVLSENPAPHSLVTRLCALRRWVYIPGPGKVCGFSLHYWRNENDGEIDGSLSPTYQRNTSSLSV